MLVPTVTLSVPKRHTPVFPGRPGSWCDPAPQALMDAHFCSGSSDPPDPHFQGMKCSVRPESAEDRLLRNDTGLLERCGELGVTDHRECSRTLLLDTLVPHCHAERAEAPYACYSWSPGILVRSRATSPDGRALLFRAEWPDRRAQEQDGPLPVCRRRSITTTTEKIQSPFQGMSLDRMDREPRGSLKIRRYVHGLGRKSMMVHRLKIRISSDPF